MGRDARSSRCSRSPPRASRPASSPGGIKGLVGQKVGSQVLLVIPPADGYGEAGAPNAGIGATDTLVFVIDLLAAR